ncbi:DUF4139 domain-containing protein [Sulfurospirillum sp. 1307]
MLKLKLFLLAISVSLFASYEPLNVELNLYKNKAILKQSFETNSSSLSIDIPAFVDLKDIKIKSICNIKKYELSNNQTFKSSDEINNIIYKIEALRAKNNLLKSIKVDNNFEEIEKISDYISTKLIENLKNIDDLTNKLQQIKQNNRFLNEYKKLEVSFTCKENSANKIEVSFPYKDIKESDFYNIYANTKNKSVSIEKFSSIDYKGIKDLENVDINIYSYAFNENIAPRKFYPRYIGQPTTYKKNMALAMAKADFSAESEAFHSELVSKSKYTLKNQKLISNQNNLYMLNKEVLDANFETFIDAYGTNKPYIKATFKSHKNFERGLANLYLDLNPIAKRNIQTIKKESLSTMYFGEDEHIQIKKELIKTLNDKTFFGDKTISTQNWKYSIKNAGKYSKNVNFTEQIPVSKDAEIKVNFIGEPKPSLKSPNGKIQWKFRLEAGESKDIIFGYEIVKDN